MLMCNSNKLVLLITSRRYLSNNVNLDKGLCTTRCWHCQRFPDNEQAVFNLAWQQRGKDDPEWIVQAFDFAVFLNENILKTILVFFLHRVIFIAAVFSDLFCCGIRCQYQLFALDCYYITCHVFRYFVLLFYVSKQETCCNDFLSDIGQACRQQLEIMQCQNMCCKSSQI